MKNEHDNLTAPSPPGVRHATFTNEDSAEVTPLYLFSHEAIDAEIVQRVRLDKICVRTDRAVDHEATRAKFHAALDAVSAPKEELLRVTRAIAKRHASGDHARQVRVSSTGR